MARQKQASEFNTFVGGLITEANPLTFPENTALDMDNFLLSKTGRITRRLGMDYEAGYQEVDSGVYLGPTGDIAITTFNWGNAGGDPEAQLVVVQTGNVLKFFDTSASVISDSLLYTHTYTGVDETKPFSAAVVDGLFVVANGLNELSNFSYDAGTISESTFKLKVRDMFGVDDGLRGSNKVDNRPPATSSNANHIYNLRNSTYSQLRLDGNSEVLRDPITTFVNRTGIVEHGLGLNGVFPSNADSVTSALFADPNDSGDRNAERFFPETLLSSPRGNYESPKGYFIIDALERGTSRLEEIALLQNSSSKYDYDVTSLSLDKTPSGASAVEQFAGRVWYGGFSGEVIDGDDYSPRMSSYLLFSKLVDSPVDLGTCHQVGDPTSKDSPDLVDTDGGFLRLDNAYGIKRMVNIGSSLVVIAANGVWAVLGGSDIGFTALAYRTVKVSDRGCPNADSVVQVGNTVFYWGDDGIYQVSPGEVEGVTSTNISDNTIQTLFNEIPELDKESARGSFDSYERKVRWIYGNRVSSDSDSVELILDVNLSAFYKNTIPGISNGLPNLVSTLEVPPFKIGEVTDDVYHEEDQVFYNAEPVVYTSNIKTNGVRELMYVAVTSTTPTVKYTFSKYKDTTFLDWKTYDAVGIDSPAYMLTGYNGGGDFQRNKQVPYVTFHFERTEDGFTADGNGDLHPDNESSCKVQAQWEWANSINSGRWGREFQAYRYKRLYMPSGASDPYDTGFGVISTKNKLRGKGKVLSLLIKTEPLKDCKLLGWSMITSVATNV